MLGDYNIPKTLLLIFSIIILVYLGIQYYLVKFAKKREKGKWINSLKKTTKKENQPIGKNENLTNSDDLIINKLENNSKELLHVKKNIELTKKIVSDQKKILDTLQIEIGIIKNLIKDNRIRGENVLAKPIPLVQNKINNSIKHNSNKVIYLSMSTENGRFIRSRDNIKIGQTYFKLKVSSKDSTKGTYSIIEGNEFITKSLLQNIRDYLQRACEVENEDLENPNTIVMIDVGKAENDGKGWKIKEKAKVRLK